MSFFGILYLISEHKIVLKTEIHYRILLTKMFINCAHCHNKNDSPTEPVCKACTHIIINLGKINEKLKADTKAWKKQQKVKCHRR